MIKIVTGSSSVISPQLSKKFNINIAPYPVYLNDSFYKDGINISPEEFLKRIKFQKERSRTSALNIKDVRDLYLNLGKDGDTIIHIHISSSLSSATYNVLTKVKSMLPDIKIELFDSLKTSTGQGILAILAAKQAHNGKNSKEIIKYLNYINKRCNQILCLPDLSFLYRGGRIGKAKSLMGTLLKLIPMITFDKKDGTVIPLGTAKNINQVNQKIINIIKEDMETFQGKEIECLITHSGDNKEAVENLVNMLKEKKWKINIEYGKASCSFLNHAGPGAWDIGYVIL